LKSPDSAKENQGNPSFFAWNYLDLLGFIWRRAEPDGWRSSRRRLRQWSR
jgi:hypothetical protein